MTVPDWTRVKELFSAALERPEAERAAWLDDAAAGDEPLRAEAWRLVQAHVEAPGFIEEPAADLHAIAASPPLAGRVLQHYQVESLIAAGGMGEVYRGTDLELGRPVAIKVVGDDDPRADERLRREARHASSLNHPNICTIYEVGHDGRRPYIVMEYVEGRPLAEVVPHGGLPIPVAITYALQIADALAHAHEHGVVHRDLKSANVTVTASGVLKLLDFGLARQIGTSAEDLSTVSLASRTGVAVAGTLGYMAPEVLRGLPPDPRSDLWAVGVLLYEMATGSLPFTGQTAFELGASILHEAPRPVPPHVPPALAAIIRHCLEKQAADRYPSAEELRSALLVFQPHAADVPRARFMAGWRAVAAARAAAGRAFTFAFAGRSRVALAAVVVLCAAAAIAYWRLGPAAISPRGDPGLAVLPFQNLAGDGQDYLADGLTEALIVELGRLPGLRVISRTTAMRYRDSRKSLPQIARELKVDVLLEGTVRREGDRVRITAKLFDADDEQAWTEAYERTMRELLVLERDIVRTVATRLQSALSLQQDARMPVVRTVDPEVYEAYLKGRYHWNKRTRESLASAREQFELATRKDPTFALAHVGLADCYNQMGTVMVGSASPAETRPRARAAALAALRLDDSLGEAHASLAYVNHYNWEWAEAGRGFERAIRLNPNYALAHIWQANYLVSLRRFQEAIASVNKARELDPLSVVVQTNVGWTLGYAGRTGEAAEAFEAALALDADYAQARMRLTSAYLGLGRTADALREAEKVVELMSRSPASLVNLAHVHAVAGRRAEAERLLAGLIAGREYVSPWGLAGLYRQLGDLESMYACLERAYQERSNGMAYFAVEYRGLDPAPRYRDLLRRVGLDKAAAAR